MSDELLTRKEFQTACRCRFDALYDQMARANLTRRECLRQALTALYREQQDVAVMIDQELRPTGGTAETRFDAQQLSAPARRRAPHRGDTPR